jgi:hypothetical protein
MKPCLFLVGCARSGTTLLERIVNAHPQVVLTPEIHWITRYLYEGPWLDLNRPLTSQHVQALIAHKKRFRQLECTAQEFTGLLDNGQATPAVRFLERLFDVYGHLKGKPLVGNKTPALVRHLAALNGAWPEAKFVHLLRDGRDVCLSVLNWYHADRASGRYATYGADAVVTTALWWARKVLLGQQSGRRLGAELYYELRYEDLIANPAETCSKLCAFLGIAYDPNMLEFHVGRTKNDPQLDAKRAWRPITPGLRDWRTQLPAADCERFEAVTGDLLDLLGYPRAHPSPAPAAVDQARHIRHLFVQDLLSRQELLPDGWS